MAYALYVCIYLLKRVITTNYTKKISIKSFFSKLSSQPNRYIYIGLSINGYIIHIVLSFAELCTLIALFSVDYMFGGKCINQVGWLVWWQTRE